MKIQCSNCNLFFEIDDEDTQKVLNHNMNWHASFYFNKKKNKNIVHNISCRSKILCETIQLSHVIIGKPEKGFVVDHINRDVLDNKKVNLRFATKSQSSMNQEKPLGLSKYKNVRRKIGCPFWYYTVRKNGKSFSKFGFLSDQDAALAANEKLKELHGEFAILNKK